MSEGTTILMQHCLDRLEAGDESACGDLINVAGERLARLAGKMFQAEDRLRRWEDSADLLQNAVLRLLRRLQNVRLATPREFFRLAAGEIRRELIDLVRHYFGPCGPGTKHETHSGWPDNESPFDPGGDVPDREQCPRALVQWGELHERVDELPDSEREAFELVWYQGLSYVESAEVLGVSARTVTRRWQSACLLLESNLGEQMPPF